MKNYKFLMLFVICVCCTSCSIKNLFFSSTSKQDTSIVETSSTTSEESVTTSSNSSEKPSKNQTFYHKFLKGDFTKEGGTYHINGLDWVVSPFAYYGASDKGIQIGSGSTPQTSPWSMKTSFGEDVVVTNIYFNISNAKNGGGIYTIDLGLDDNPTKTTFEDAFSTDSVTQVSFSDLNVSCDTFALTLQSTTSKAMYLYDLSFDVIVGEDSTLNIKSDYYDPQPVIPGQDGIPNTAYALTSKEEYYQDVDLTLTGDVLKNELNSKISKMTGRSYGDAKTMLQYIDENPSKPGYMYGLYDGDDIIPTWDSGATWNREHVWACAQMNLTGTARPTDSTINHSTDLHNLRVTCASMNGYHSNKFYDLTNSSNTMYPNVNNDVVSGYHNYSGDHRGDVARILFYMYVCYDRLKLIDDLTIADNLSMGKLSVLLEWNELDPVDEFEIQRNNRIYEYQGNRNPFIDYPELVQQIF